MPADSGGIRRALGLLAGVAAGLPVVSAYVLQDAPRWPDGVVTFELQLGAAPAPLLDGAASFDDAAAAALDRWNLEMGRLQLRARTGSTAPIGQGNRRNNVFFADDAFGRDFGERTLAITFTRWTSGSRGAVRTEADVVFNRQVAWDSYRGRLRSRGGEGLADLRRVALHEFGHALGLEHPDEAGQSVSAVMNATVGHLDALAADDIDGARALYGEADSASTGPVEPPPTGSGESGQLINLSVRSRAGRGDRTLIAGFVTAGGPRTLLMRGIGPSLAKHRVADPLADPQLALYAGTAVRTANDNWGGTSALSADFSAAGAFALSGNSRDAALRERLPAGRYTLHLTAADGAFGVGLTEIYALAPNGDGGQLVNLSARTEVGVGADVLIIGFVVAGERPVRVLVRGVGPSLVEFGVGNRLANPHLALYRADTVLAENDDWAGAADVVAAGRQAGAFALPPDSRDAALVAELAPGNYTAQVSGVGGTTGVALVELYLLP